MLLQTRFQIKSDIGLTGKTIYGQEKSSAMSKEKIKLRIEELREQISTVRVGFLIRYFVTIFALCIISYLLNFVGESMINTVSMAETYKDEPKIWFQRSGAVLVCLAIILEFGVIKILKMENDDRDKANEQGGEITFKIMYLVAHIFAFSCAIIGTLVWGYGDIFYSHYFE